MTRKKASARPAKPDTTDTPEAIEQADMKRQALRLRFDAVRSTLASDLAPNPEQVRAILKARAAQIAGQPEGSTKGAAHLTLIEFLLAHERYAFEPDFVREVVPLKTLTPVPCTPGFVLGVTNLRGEIVSVIDLKRFFDLPHQGLTNASRLIVLQSPTMTLGVIADSVIGTRSIRADAVQPPLPTHTGIRERYLKGVAEGRLAILNAGSILTDDRIMVHEEVASPSPGDKPPRP